MIIELRDGTSTQQHKVECKYCMHVFVAGASRIKEHFLHIIPTRGEGKCTADEAVLQPVLDEMGAIDAHNKAAAAEQRRLDRSTAANASTCKEAADACGVQGSSEQTWLSAPRSWSRGLAQAPASKIFSNDEECQGSDAEDSSNSDKDSSSDEE